MATPSDDVRAALEMMKTRQVRRLPVIGHDGRLAGIVSIHDIALQARAGKGAGIPAEDVLDTFIAITVPSPTRMAVPA